MTIVSDITVIIPCLNEERYLPLVLTDLSHQKVAPAHIIIVDSKSADGTVAVAKSWSKRLPISVVTSPKRSPAYARNSGAAAAKTDYLLFVDADMRLPKDFVEQIVKSL